MKIAKMTLKKYRNYDNLEVSFNDNLNIIIGDNAQGKTNLLESIYAVSYTHLLIYIFLGFLQVLQVSSSFGVPNRNGIIKCNIRKAKNTFITFFKFVLFLLG